MEKVLLSITMATYNVEEFIAKSIESILSQTYQDFELICIDDGSKDNTLRILREFETSDSRIKVISKKKNQGLAVARNESLKLAIGKYITFLDGDDIYDLTLFEKAIHLAEKENSDIVYWDYVTFYKPEEIPKLQAKKSDLLKINVNDKKAWLKRPSFTWVKLIRTEKARELKIHFPDGLTRQDIPVHWNLVTLIDKVSILPERLAFYRQQPNATTAKKDEKLFHLVYVMDIVEKYLKDNQLYNKYRFTFLDQRVNFFAGMYDNIKPELKEKAKQLILERMTSDVYSHLKSKNNLRLHTRYFFSSLNGNLLGKIKLKTWEFTRVIFRKFKK
jgi:glycosyltransferase involved in cell wall biosynthesis